ncbi:MAG: N-acetylneuraminate synthase family protein [Candidatus Margulisbacteria bacterium]|nr:N-acetylneuraminate synthase family protein [Candidatus Margulisiibacteriota bacterium]
MKKNRKKLIKIGRRKIGDNQPTFIIAEVGSNHNRDLKLAKKIIRKISKTGADAVKFQSFKADLLVNKKHRPDAYKLLKNNELPREWHKPLKKYAERCGLIFLSTPFDFEAVDLLKRLNVPAYKISSGDITNIPLIRYIARVGKPLIISVGAADDKIIQNAVQAADEEGNNRIVLCQCVVSYPTEYSDANVRVLGFLKQKFGTLVGYSDHSREDLVPILAIAKGAVIIERHVTLSRSMRGPDHAFALEIGELKQMIKNIRKTEKILGEEKKKILSSELGALFRARRGVYLAKSQKKGHKISSKHLCLLRPAKGVSPNMYEGLLGKKLNKTISTLDPIYEKDIVGRVS